MVMIVGECERAVVTTREKKRRGKEERENSQHTVHHGYAGIKRAVRA
jgi:hypothetical protein